MEPSCLLPSNQPCSAISIGLDVITNFIKIMTIAVPDAEVLWKINCIIILARLSSPANVSTTLVAWTSAKMMMFSKKTLMGVITITLLLYECFFPTLPCAFDTPTENAIFFTPDQCNLPRCITNETLFKHRTLLLSTLTCSGNKSTELSVLLNGLANRSLFLLLLWRPT